MNNLSLLNQSILSLTEDNPNMQNCIAIEVTYDPFRKFCCLVE